MQQESIFIPIDHHNLHLRHIWQDSNQKLAPVLMIHGAIENGKIFYTEKGKGFGCYLAENGFDVFVSDLRGRGKSKPSIKEDPDHGQHQSIVEDIPALINYVYQLHQVPVHIVCHSWGGVLFASCLARFPELRQKIASNVCFGTKRQVTVWNLERIFKVSLIWKRLAPMITKRVGYLDAVKFNIGSDNETHKTLKQGSAWVKLSHWVDSEDGFNYARAAKHCEWPPTWHLTGIKDKVLGHQQDVRLFIEESHNVNAKFSVLSTQQGSLVDYDHIDILTSPKARDDHFPKIVDWLKRYTVN